MVKSCEQESICRDLQDTLRRHTTLGPHKLVSYLPRNTIENVMRMPLATYTSMIENNGGSYLIFGEDECCIASGAVYAFLPKELSAVLRTNKSVLAKVGLPYEPTAFIQAIAATWFETGAQVMPLLKELFGDI